MNIKKRDLIAFAVGVVATVVVGMVSMAIGSNDGQNAPQNNQSAPAPTVTPQK